MNNQAKKSYTDQHSIAMNAFNAARKCNDAGSFLKEEITTIMVAIEQLDLPAPAVKLKPIEWKEMTTAGHEPGSWPHVLAHMRDIAENNKTTSSITFKIKSILKAMNDLDKYVEEEEWSALSEERNRLIRYRTFLESVLEDIVLVMEAACSRLKKLADEEQELLREQEMQRKEERRVAEEQRVAAEQAAAQAAAIEAAAKAAAEAAQIEQPNTKRLTPQSVHSALVELCHGRIKSLSARYKAAKRILVLVRIKAEIEITANEAEAIDMVIHAFVKETLEHDRRVQGKNLNEAAWRWMKTALESAADEIKSKSTPTPTDPLTILRKSGEQKLQPDTIYKMMQDAILYRMNEGDDEYEAVNQADAALDQAIADSQNRFGEFNKEEMGAIEDAKERSAMDLFAEENPPLVQAASGSEPTDKKASLSSSSGGFANDALRHQIAQVMQSIEDGNIPRAQA